MTVGRSFMLGAALALGMSAAAPRAGAQTVTARFEIASVGDSTFRFAIGPQRWAAERRRGIVVDPAKRDALVARFRVLSVQADTITALVTGQTTLVTTEHFVVMVPPPLPPWHKRPAFWTAATLGAAVGMLLGAALF